MFSLFRLVHQLGIRLVFPISWTIICITLLSLPGNAIPGMGLFGIKNLDKLAHIGLFGGFVVFWSVYASSKLVLHAQWVRWHVLITAISIGLGIAMEYVQANFIPNRSFDTWDIWADVFGSVLVMVLLLIWGRAWGLLKVAEARASGKK